VTSARLFTDIDQLKLGDEFTITVLDNVLTYEVDSIQVVLPEETTALEIVDGENLVTLQTCTPYGINSHRLLVRGKCIKAEKLKSTETKQNTFEETVTTVMSVLMNKRNITPVIAAGAILLVFVILRIAINIHRNSRRKKAMLNTILEVNEVKNNNAETV
jgi:sortase A